MSAGNRAFYSVGSSNPVHACSVARLVNMGAQLVGMTKTYAFASHSDGWADYAQPFSTRADGQRSASGSSTGSAAALASHAWLDIALGSDTGGSTRVPAAVMGLYGIRPSLGAMPFDGVIPLFEHRDTLTYLFADFGRLWYGDELRLKDTLPRVVYVKREFLSDHAADRQLESVLQAAAAHLGVQVVPVSIEGIWNRTQSGTLAGAMVESNGRVARAVLSRHAYDSFGRQLIADYRRKNDGRQPYIPRGDLEDWMPAPPISFDDERRFRARDARISAWLRDESGLVAPIDRHEPEPDEYNRNHWALSPITGVPDITIPIGQVPWHSSISNKTEQLPVAMHLMSAFQTDGMLLNLVETLGRAGVLKTVLTGPTAFSQDRTSPRAPLRVQRPW